MTDEMQAEGTGMRGSDAARADAWRDDGISANGPLPRDRTHRVRVGDVGVGGGAPVAVQSMLSCSTEDPQACLSQIDSLVRAGCEIVRLAIPRAEALDGFSQVCEASPVPVVADIHFDYRLALGAIARGASKLRINPGNIGSAKKVDAVIEAAGEAGIPIRIGVNAGSLELKLRDKEGWTLAEKLVESARRSVEHFEDRGFRDIVVSAKAHDVVQTVETYRLLSREMPSLPLHIGITEAGTIRQGTVKSAVGLGMLLGQGIGDTMRVSLTGDVTEEVRVAWEILASLGLRRRTPELISCPTCGRTKIDLIGVANEVQQRLESIQKPLKVAVMGCVVNGPGEAADADVGVAGGDGVGVVFSHGKVIRKVAEDEIADALFEEIDRLS